MDEERNNISFGKPKPASVPEDITPELKRYAVYIMDRIRSFLMDIGKLSMLEDMRRSAYPDYENKGKHPFRILISTILSVRNRDENTVEAVRNLFDNAGLDTPEKILEADPEVIMALIKKSGMYRIKTKRIREASRYILENFNGKVPDNLEDLIKIPGVGRKIANCVLVYAFGKDAVPVDVHVHRISNRTGLVATKRPIDTEKLLMLIYPREYWRVINDAMVVFGKTVCRPLGPLCKECPIGDVCPRLIRPPSGKNKKSGKSKRR